MHTPFIIKPLFAKSFAIGFDQTIHIKVFQRIVNQSPAAYPSSERAGKKNILSSQTMPSAANTSDRHTSLGKGEEELLWNPKSLLHSVQGSNLEDLVSSTSKWLFIQLPYHKHTLDFIRRIPHRSYNVADRYWIAPLTQESIEVLELLEWENEVYVQLKSLIERKPFEITPHIGPIEGEAGHDAISDIITDQSVSAQMPERLNSKAGDLHHKQISASCIEVTILRFHIHVRLHYSRDNVVVMKMIKGAYWCSRQRVWKIPKDRESLDQFQAFTSYWPKDVYNRLVSQINPSTRNERLELYFTPEYSQSVVLKLTGTGVDIAFIKSLPHRRYDQERQRWIIPNDQALIKRVLNHFKERNAEIINRLIFDRDQGSSLQFIKASTIQYLLNKYGNSALDQMEAFILVLVQKRYSQHTVRMYVSALSACWESLGSIGIKDATTADINQYLSHLAVRGVSDARMHLAVNAIKFYYTHVDQSTAVKVQFINRPKNASQLPEILSIKEIDMLLRSLCNIKPALCIRGS
jgi:hypothetical protein